MELNTFNTKKDKYDSKLQKCEDEIEQNVRFRCRENLNEYLNSSTLHGLRYVGERTITRGERAFFVCMFVLVVLLSIYFITNVWMKWSLTPIIITLSSESTSVMDIPFPAVTICNMNQVLKSEAEKFPKNSSEYYVVNSLCRMGTGLEQNTTEETTSWDMYEEMLKKVAPTCKSMLQYCQYGGETFECTSRFSTILTDDGMCCIFNGIHKKFLMKTDSKKIEEYGAGEAFNQKEVQWTPETGYSTEAKFGRNNYPRPAVGAGNELGLSVILNGKVSEYFCSSTRSYGFKVLLHSPNDLPKVAHYGMAIPNNYESRLVIMPTISRASHEIREMSKEVRQCIFENENFLTYYSIYSERSCLDECVTKLLLKYCNCVSYFNPREHENISICGIADGDCIEQINLEFDQNSTFQCSECLSGCFNIEYDSTLSMAKIFDSAPFLRTKRLQAKNVAILHTYYDSSSFRSQKKEELVGFTDFLSNIGGLLGLFMGFSVISVVELFYFMSIRPYCNHIRYAKQRREIMARLVQKVDILRLKTNSPGIIETVESESDLYPHPYLD